MSKEEPWLRGPIPSFHPLVAPVVRSLEQVEEDLIHWTHGLTDEDLWRAPEGLAPLGFQLKHIAGSIDRLMTYARGEALSEQQMSFMRSETSPRGTLAEVLGTVQATIDRAKEEFRAINPDRLTEFRGVGRKQLPTTLGGLLFHAAEHAQRHLGQAIVTIRALRAEGV